jgi:predicted N-acetyltransferase YhbS
VVTEGAEVVVGYYCLATGAVTRAGAPSRLRRNAPDPVPVAIIGRLAVASHHARLGIGGGMLQDAFRRIIQVSQVAGCAAVIVHAIDDAAGTFYARFGFVEFPAGSKTLFLPVQTLRAAIG